MKSILWLPLLVCSILVLHAGETPLPGFKTDMNLPNGCYIKSIAYEDALKSFDGNASTEAASILSKDRQRWVRVLVVGFRDEEKTKYHAVCVFTYNDSIWVYDPNFGTYRLSASVGSINDPNLLARKWNSTVDITSACFVDPNARNIAASRIP